MIRWRWDQGRVAYLEFVNLRTAAGALLSLDGAPLSGADSLRAPMMSATGLDFLPGSYTLWRNYARVYQLTLLVAPVADRLVCTELCRSMATDQDFGVDQLLATLIKRTYFPHPAFEGYQRVADRIFPFAVLLKLLLTRAPVAGQISISEADVAALAVSRRLTGTESLDTYTSLRPSPITVDSAELRQVREAMRFLSQLSVLKWRSGSLYLDVDNLEPSDLVALKALSEPDRRRQLADPSQEILALASDAVSLDLPSRESQEDIEFTEGHKVRRTHLQTERSRILRAMFFRALEGPATCDMCRLILTEKYPWAPNLIEVHHLLPLGSGLAATRGSTLLRDLVGVCPNCHRATHVYYKHWLRQRQWVDFPNVVAARDAYNEACAKVRLR